MKVQLEYETPLKEQRTYTKLKGKSEFVLKGNAELTERIHRVQEGDGQPKVKLKGNSNFVKSKGKRRFKGPEARFASENKPTSSRLKKTRI